MWRDNKIIPIYLLTYLLTYYSFKVHKVEGISMKYYTIGSLLWFCVIVKD